MAISRVMSGGRYVGAPLLFPPRFSSRLSRTTPQLLACALALASTPAFSADVSEAGAPGSPGATGLVGQAGGSGGDAAASLLNSDFFNTATATGGKGGNGGASLLLLVPGGNGGAGGKATAHQQSGDLPFVAFEDSPGAATITATGGAGGNGGGLIRGNGGVGGAATALSNVDAASGEGATGAFLLQSTNVSGVGGNGGTGRNGGAGGASTAAGIFFGPSDGSSIVATSQGGAGGAATFNGGRGGDATASANYNGGGQPSDNFVVSTAVGGNGGSSVLGRNGDGGNAVAEATGRHGSRALGVSVTANARGGDSGNHALPFAPQGNGGNAFASASAEAVNFPTSGQADARARGGDGVLRGGDAVANAKAVGPFASSQAVAAGGAGRQVGASIATAVTTNDYFGLVGSTATATSANKFARSVVVNASVTQDFDNGSTVPATVFAQARTGDTTAAAALAPTPAAAPGVVARAAAVPAASEVAAVLAGNPVIAGQAAVGSVWGVGDFATRNEVESESGIVSPFDSIDATTTFTFDVSERSPSHLWLGLLDSSLPSDAIGNFHFSITGESSTLFEHDFTGSDFLSFFDDRLLDLGDWSSLVSSDGLFDLAVTFSGIVPEIRFAFGDTAQQPASVREPSALVLLLTGLFGIAWVKRRR